LFSLDFLGIRNAEKEQARISFSADGKAKCLRTLLKELGSALP
jgi:hypothetical protein